MKRKITLIFFFTLFTFLFIGKVFAKEGVVINSIYLDSDKTLSYVELFNNSETDEDISKWTIYDSDTSCKQNKTSTNSAFSDGTILKAKDKIKLFGKNTTITIKDKIFLYDKDNNLIDSWGFGSLACQDLNPDPTINLTPSITQTIGRCEDGTDNLQIYPCITISPYPTLSPTISITPSVTPTLTPSPTLTITPTPIDYSKWEIRLNEIYASPESGEKEWVELYNSSSEDRNLKDWIIDDSASTSSKCKTLDSTFIIKANNYLSIECSSNVLNNSGDDVNLIAPDKTIIDEITYPEIDSSQSYDYFSDGWKITSITTKNEENKIGEVKGLANELFSISDARQEDNDAIVTVSGIVTVNPGIVGKDLFYIQDSSAGIRIDIQDDPGLKPGDKIEITGNIDEIRNEKRITAESINIAGSDPIPKPLALKTSQVNEKVEGELVTVRGNVIENSGSTFVVSDGGKGITVNIPSTSGIKKPTTRIGYFAIITGIVSQYGTKDGEPFYRILPRFQSDVVIAKTEALANTGDNLILQEIFGITLLLVLIILYFDKQNCYRN